MSRVRKAYEVHVDGWGWDEPVIEFAPYAGKAKYVTYLKMTDAGYDVSLINMRAARSPVNDMALPDEHRLVAELSKEERGIVLHAYGSQSYRAEGFRDHYCTHAGNLTLLRLAWELGLFDGPYGDPYGSESIWSGAFFHLTELGKAVARSMLPTYR